MPGSFPLAAAHNTCIKSDFPSRVNVFAKDQPVKQPRSLGRFLAEIYANTILEKSHVF